MNDNLKNLHVKRSEEKSLANGRLWIFSNQIESSLKDFEPGEIIRLTTRNDKFLGVGYVNPHSLIAARLLSREERIIDVEFLSEKFRQARHLREKIFPDEEAVREVFSESDGLPGLIVDRYGDILVMQITTAGMDRLRDIIVKSLLEIYQPAVIYEKSNASVRKLEGLEDKCGLLYGDLPAEPGKLNFAGVDLVVDFQHGQKTGLFLDQRKNIEAAAQFCDGARVLDAFCYIGGWGLKALQSGARHVTFLDSSEAALERARSAVQQMDAADRCRFLKADALKTLKSLAQEKEKFDLLILDPPSFIKSKARYREGYQGYFDLNKRAISLVNKNGYLMTCSCSHHMRADAFEELMQRVLVKSGRQGRILYRGFQGPDHPILLSMPETEYLHCLLIQVL